MNDIEVAAAVHEVRLAHGDWPNAAGVRQLEGDETAKEIVIGSGVARTFGSDVGKDMLLPGDTVILGPAKWSSAASWRKGPTPSAPKSGRATPMCRKTLAGRIRTAPTSSAPPAREGEAGGQGAEEFQERSHLQAYTEREYYAKMSETSSSSASPSTSSPSSWPSAASSAS